MQLENDCGFYGENVKNHWRTLKKTCLSRLRVVKREAWVAGMCSIAFDCYWNGSNKFLKERRDSVVLFLNDTDLSGGNPEMLTPLFLPATPKYINSTRKQTLLKTDTWFSSTLSVYSHGPILDVQQLENHELYFHFSEPSPFS